MPLISVFKNVVQASLLDWNDHEVDTPTAMEHRQYFVGRASVNALPCSPVSATGVIAAVCDRKYFFL
jgi:hypothetical protein